MKKLLLLPLLMGFVLLNAQNPVTLNQTNMPFGPQAYKPIVSTTTGVALPAQGADKTWNYSTLNQSQVYNYAYTLPANSNFPTATYVDPHLQSVFVTGKVFYYDAYYENKASGNVMLGNTINSQHYYIGDLTGGAHDSCIYPQQVFLYNTQPNLIKYPATMSSSWRNNYIDIVRFNLTIAAYGLNNAQCKRVTHIILNDTVVGWGKVTVPTSNGPSEAYDALMIKRIYEKKDSFYLNNAPAPPALLTAFGLSQGQTTLSNRYIFWRPNAVYPIMMFNFGSNNFTVPNAVIYDGLANPATGIYDLNDEDIFTFYPNPASDFIIFNLSNNFKGSIEILNTIGEKIKCIGDEQIQSNQIKVNLTDFKSGVYFVRVKNNNEFYTKKLIIK